MSKETETNSENEKALVADETEIQKEPQSEPVQLELSPLCQQTENLFNRKGET